MSQPNDNRALARRLEANEIGAWRSMYQAQKAELAELLGIGCDEQAGAFLLWNRAAPVFLFNRMMGLGVFEPASEAAIDVLLARAQDEKSRCEVQLTPGPQAAEIGAWLSARGLVRAPAWLMHYRALDQLPKIEETPGYRIERVAPDQAPAWGDALLAAWDFPDWAATGALATVLPVAQNPRFSCYAAVHIASGQIAGGGILFAEHGVAGLFADGVRSEHRQHNLQAALIATRLAEGRQHGCDIAASQTLASHPAERNMQSAGFAVAYERMNYVFSK